MERPSSRSGRYVNEKKIYSENVKREREREGRRVRGMKEEQRRGERGWRGSEGGEKGNIERGEKLGGEFERTWGGGEKDRKNGETLKVKGRKKTSEGDRRQGGLRSGNLQKEGTGAAALCRSDFHSNHADRFVFDSWYHFLSSCSPAKTPARKLTLKRSDVVRFLLSAFLAAH